jgi:hypothetical protein
MKITLRERLDGEGSQLVTSCHRLKLRATDGNEGSQLVTDCYRFELAAHDDRDGGQSVTQCNQLKLPGADAGICLADVANSETLPRLIWIVPGGFKILQSAIAKSASGKKFQSVIGKSVISQPRLKTLL